MELRRTPLFPVHQKYKGKLIDFGGWGLPVEYTGIIEEHHKVRNEAGLFDVSHMGEVEVRGDQAEAFINNLITNDIRDMAENQVRYSPMCYPDGGVVDDLMVYKFSGTHYMLVINATNTDKDFAWIREHLIPGVTIENVSSRFAELALQGPLAQEILQPLCDVDLRTIRYYRFNPGAKVAEFDCILSRTGYTGEDGFEIYVYPVHACDLWEAILEAGKGRVAPIGLGARDTLRFEAKMPLYGHELDRNITPLEAGLDRYVKFDKPDFIGKEALLRQKAEGPRRVLAEFEMVGRGIPRAHYEVRKEGEKIGHVTSGGYAPTLDKNIGLCLIKREFSQPGEEIDVIIRNKPVRARVNRGLFYKRNKK